MYIVIAGGGQFGRSLARKLVEGKHDVVVVEERREVCEQISARVGALAVQGSATLIDVLEDAGIGKAEVAVAALPTDADNLAFSLLAKNYDVPRVIARMSNPQYEKAYKLAGISLAFNVSELFVRQMALEIEQPAVRQVATFGKGQASIVVTQIPPGAAVHEKTVREIASDKNFPSECVIAGIFRLETGQFVFPRGNAQVRQWDQVFLAARTDELRKAAAYLRRTI